MTADNYAELVRWLIHSAECHEDVDGKPSIRAEWLRKTAGSIEALVKERDQLRAEVAKLAAEVTRLANYAGTLRAELARVKEADRLTSFGGLTVCPTCKVFTDMDRHWCYPLPGGAFCMGFKDALAAGKGEV